MLGSLATFVFCTQIKKGWFNVLPREIGFTGQRYKTATEFLDRYTNTDGQRWIATLNAMQIMY